MEVEFIKTVPVLLNTLSVGDVFKYDGRVFMLLEYSTDKKILIWMFQKNCCVKLDEVLLVSRLPNTKLVVIY